jgi:hypothetical protein
MSSNKSGSSRETKKSGRSLKEKRTAKQDKQADQAAARRAKEK